VDPVKEQLGAIGAGPHHPDAALERHGLGVPRPDGFRAVLDEILPILTAGDLVNRAPQRERAVPRGLLIARGDGQRGVTRVGRLARASRVPQAAWGPQAASGPPSVPIATSSPRSSEPSRRSAATWSRSHSA
jgi:hypothetical protein